MKVFDSYQSLAFTCFAHRGKLLARLCAIAIPIIATVISVSVNFHVVSTKKSDSDKVSLFFPNRTYTAEYEIIQSDDPQGPRRQRISCNGKGLYIHEWNNLKFLLEKNRELEFIIDPSESKIYIHRLKQNGAAWLDEEVFFVSDYESSYFKYLGEEKIGSHQCRVYGSELLKRYYDKDTRLLVLQKGGDVSRTFVSKLLSYSSQALPNSDFELPKNFLVRDHSK
jgi:hypothetical protein